MISKKFALKDINECKYLTIFSRFCEVLIISTNNYNTYIELDRFYLFVFLIFTNSFITTDFYSQLTETFHKQLVYKKTNKSQTGVALFKGVNFSFVYTSFSLWMNGYRQKQLCSIVIYQLEDKNVYSHYFTILNDFFLRSDLHLPV